MAAPLRSPTAASAGGSIGVSASTADGTETAPSHASGTPPQQQQQVVQQAPQEHATILGNRKIPSSVWDDDSEHDSDFEDRSTLSGGSADPDGAAEEE